MNNEERALAYAQDIARFIRHETVQRPGSEEAFAALHEEMRVLFPEVHRVCERVEVDGSLMYRWPGESSDDALLLMSHHDVVAANADEWLFPEVHRVCERVEVDGSLMYRWPGESSDDALLLMSHHDVVAANADEWSCDPFAGEIERVEVDGSLMYRWPGESSDDALLLMSHHDVVAANADEWSCDPFAGEIRDGKLWGRGTLDVKGNLYCIFRAVEELIDEGFTPAHDVYLVTSNCEEAVARST